MSLHAFSYTLDQLGDSPYVVEVYALTIKGTLKSPSGNVTLRARTIEFAPGASIDVSGGDGGPSGKASSGKTVNEGGSAGSPTGIDGQGAGVITLICESLLGDVNLLAHGGAGSKGQEGGDGGPGSRGPQGPMGGVGGTGGQGAAAGAGGKGGNGGAGGTITLNIVNNKATHLSTNVQGGLPGQAGDSGQPGQGGPQGDNGPPRPPIFRCPPPRPCPAIFVPDKPLWQPAILESGHRFQEHQAMLEKASFEPAGGDAQQGALGVVPPSLGPGTAGLDGALSVSSVAQATRALARGNTDPYLQLVLSNAEQFYFNAQYALAGDLLAFVTVLTA